MAAERPRRFYEKYGKEYAEVTSGIVVRGDLCVDPEGKNVRIGGIVEGSVSIPGVFQILEGGRCTGDVKAACVIVSGIVDGELHAEEKIELRQTAIVNGDIQSPHLAVAEGASFNGSIRSGECNMHSFKEQRSDS